MNLCSLRNSASALLVAALVLGSSISAYAADAELLDVLLENGVITAEQHALLIAKEKLTSEDILPAEAVSGVSADADVDMAADSDDYIRAAVADEVATRIEEDFPVKASHGSSGFRLETRDGDWQTNLQWRAQLRYTNPFFGDPRQVDDFEDPGTSNFEARRLRMKIGGHGFKPWLKYYFEVDLQPSRDPGFQRRFVKRARYRLAHRHCQVGLGWFSRRPVED